MNIKMFITNPSRIVVSKKLDKITRYLPAQIYLKCAYRAYFNKSLDLKNPKTYTEKLQWLKLYDHKPIYTTMVDKYEVKKFVSKRIGEEYIIETLGVWENFKEITFDELPEQFVLKCTHDSAGLVICKDKKTFDKNAAEKKLNACLKRNFYYAGREWPYKNVKPRIIAEKYMEDSEYKELRDYKFFTFAGIPKVLYITQGRGAGQETTADFFDMDFKHLPFVIDHSTAEVSPKPPVNFELMKTLAEKLSSGTPQLRVDFYEVDGKVYFGELTFFHCSGFNAFHPASWDEKFGSWVNLPSRRQEGRMRI